MDVEVRGMWSVGRQRMRQRSLTKEDTRALDIVNNEALERGTRKRRKRKVERLTKQVNGDDSGDDKDNSDEMIIIMRYYDDNDNDDENNNT